MSQTRVTLTLIGALAVVCLLLIGAFVLAAYLVDIFLGIGVLLLLLLAAAGWRKWQHSRIPVNEDRREQRRVLLEEEERRERLRMERERHAHEIQLAAERHRQELDMRWQAFELQRHLSLSRAPYDDNGNPPIFVHQDGQYIQLPPANPPYRLVQSRTGGEQKQLAAPAESVAPVPDPVDAYALLASGQWTPSKQALLLACSSQGLVTVAINLAWHIGLAGSTGGGKCLEENEPVFLADGRIVKAKDLIGQRVDVIGVTDTESMQQVPVPASFRNNGVHPVLEIELDNGVVLKRTEAHPLWAARLHRNQHVGLRKKNGKIDDRTRAINAGWIQAKDIKVSGNRDHFVGHAVLCPIFLAQQGAQRKDEHEVILCAALLAEGGLTNGRAVRFTTASARMLEVVSKAIKEYGCELVPIPVAGRTLVDYRVRNQEHRKGMENQISTLTGVWGMRCLAHKKIIPAWVFQLPNDQIALFLRIFFDCDGWVDTGMSDRSPSANICLASRVMVQQLGQLALRLGITGTYREKPNRHAGAWVWSTPQVEEWQKRIGLEIKAEALSIAITQKMALRNQATTEWKRWRRARPAPGQHFADCPTGYEWRKVKATRVSEAPTVAIEVHNGNHAFVGHAVEHNTNSLRLLLAQLAQHYEVYYISPAFAPIKANHEDWRQIEARLSGEVACEAPEIEARLQWAVETYRERQLLEREGDFSWRAKPIYVVIDEYIAVIKRYPGAAEDVSELLRFARQYQVFVVVASQDFLIKNIGGDSGARDCYRTALYFGGDPTTARTLLDISGTLPYEQDLGKEGLLVLRTKSTQVSQARAPFMSNRAIYELLGWPEDPILDDAPVTAARPGGTRWEAAGTPPMEPLYPRPTGPWGPDRAARDAPPPGPSTGKLAPVVDALAEPAGTRPERASGAPRSSEEKQFTLEQEMRFVRLYRANQNIRECLRAMQLGNRYYTCASRLVEARKLRKV